MTISSLFKNVTIVDASDVLGNKTITKVKPTDRFVDAVKKQIQAIKWDISKEGNEPEKLKRWYSVNDGKAQTFLRYSVKKVLILPGMTEEKSVYQVGKTLQDVLKFYENVLKAAQAGDLDTILDKVAEEMIQEREATKAKNKSNPEWVKKSEEAKAKRKAEKALLNNSEETASE